MIYPCFYSDRMSAAGCLEHIWLKDDCSLDRQIYLQPQSDAEEEEEEEEDDDEEVEDEEEPVDEEEDEGQTVEEPATEPTQQQQPTAQQQHQHQQQPHQLAKSGSLSKPTHNGHHRANSSGSISKIPIATSKLLSSPSSETTTAIHTLTSNGNTNGNGHIHKPTQIVTPTRRASDSDKENTYTATFVKKPVATIQLGSSNGIEDATVVATLTLFPDAPTTPKVIRKTPTGESNGSATSVKALVKKFQLEDSSGPAMARRSGGSVTSGSGLHSPTTTAASVRMNSIRRASEPLTTVYKKQQTPQNGCSSSISSPSPSPGSSPTTTTSGSTATLLIHSQRLASSTAPASHSAAPATATATATSSASSSNSSSSSSGKTASAAHHLHHHHMHHHHHHHHHHVVIAAKNAAAVAATNNLSLDQGIIC